MKGQPFTTVLPEAVDVVRAFNGLIGGAPPAIDPELHRNGIPQTVRSGWRDDNEDE